MKITSVETFPVRVPIRPEMVIRGSLGIHDHSPFVLLKVRTDEGITGIGEVSSTAVWSGEDAVTAVYILEKFLVPALLGEDPRDIERLTVKMRRAVFGHFFTKAGLEMALWDILGKAAGLPVYRLLGGAIREWVPIKMSVSGLEPGPAAKRAEWAMSIGIRALKVKTGIEPKSDIARVQAVRAAVGPDFPVGVDANGGWSPRVAIQCIREIHDTCNIIFAEQPVAALDMQWMVDVRQAVSVPVMADESCNTPQDAMALVRAGAADILSVYVGKGGGIGSARKITAIAEAAGLTCTVGSNLELGVASAAMAHLAMASPGIGAEEFPCDILGPVSYLDDVVVEPIEYADGRVRASARPGLGVELNDAKLKQYAY